MKYDNDRIIFYQGLFTLGCLLALIVAAVGLKALVDLEVAGVLVQIGRGVGAVVCGAIGIVSVVSALIVSCD